MVDFNYEAEKKRIEKDLNNGKFDIEVLENTGKDFEDGMNEDFAAFKRHLNSDEFTLFAQRILKK